MRATDATRYGIIVTLGTVRNVLDFPKCILRPCKWTQVKRVDTGRLLADMVKANPLPVTRCWDGTDDHFVGDAVRTNHLFSHMEAPITFGVSGASPSPAQ